MNETDTPRDIRLIETIKEQDQSPSIILDLFLMIDPNKEGAVQKEMRDHLPDAIKPTDVELIKSIYTEAADRYPKMPEFNQNDPIPMITLWHNINIYQRAMHIYKDVDPEIVKRYTPSTLFSYLETRTFHHRNDKKNAKFTISPSNIENLQQALIRAVSKDSQSFAEAKNRITDLVFAASIYKRLSHPDVLTLIKEIAPASDIVKGTKSEIKTALLEYDGVQIPILIKIPIDTSDARDDIQREIDFIDRWKKDNEGDFLAHSSLQTPIIIGDTTGLIMLDLGKLGYLKPEDVFASVNAYTHVGREYLLNYLCTITGWLKSIENHSVPIDTFPRETVRTDPLNFQNFRTFDYGLFKNKSTTNTQTTTHKMWFDVSWGSAGIKNIPILTSLWKRSSKSIIEKDSVLEKLNFYKNLTVLSQNFFATWSDIYALFLETKEDYKDTAFHADDDAISKIPISPSIARRELTSILTPEQKQQLKLKTVEQSDLSPFNVEIHRANTMKACLHSPGWELFTILGAKLRITTIEAEQLIEHASVESMNTLYEALMEGSI